MRIQINDRRFTLGGRWLTYSLYWHRNTTAGPVVIFQKILVHWANALRDLGPKNSPMFLPFAPEDQEIECLKATLEDEKIRLVRVEVAEDGVAFDWNDIEGFIRAPHETYDEPNEDFGLFDKDELISALTSVQVIAS